MHRRRVRHVRGVDGHGAFGHQHIHLRLAQTHGECGADRAHVGIRRGDHEWPRAVVRHLEAAFAAYQPHFAPVRTDARAHFAVRVEVDDAAVFEHDARQPADARFVTLPAELGIREKDARGQKHQHEAGGNTQAPITTWRSQQVGIHTAIQRPQVAQFVAATPG